MIIYSQKPNRYGFAPILIIVLVVIIAGFSILVIKNIPFKQSNPVPNAKESTGSAEAKASPTTVSEVPKLTAAAKATPTPTKTPSLVSSPTITPTPQAKTITVSGFAYEDRTNDGLFNSDDPKLKYMQFLIYDSSSNEQINTIYTEQDGQFVVINTVRGNLTIKPTCNDNFCPKDGSREFSSSSSNQQFAFRSASAPTSNNNGVIEGDLIIAGDRPYKFYLLDKNDSYYSNIEWSGGHFKIQNLPNNQTYIIRISYGDNSPDNTEVTLSPSTPEQKTLQIHVRK